MALAYYLVFFFLISHQLLLSLSEQDFNNPRCPPFRCGHLGSISFPFSNRTHPDCGLLIVDNCTQPFNPTIQLAKNEPSFYVYEISQDNTLDLHEKPFLNLLDKPTCKSLRNFTFPRSPSFSFNITSMQPPLFKCPRNHYTIPINYSLLCNYSTHSVILHNFNLSDPKNCCNNSSPAQCSVIRPRVTKTRKHVVFYDILTVWFLLRVNVTSECYECYRRGGQCESDSKGNFYCTKTGT